MCHTHPKITKINRLHERCLRLIHNDKKSSFEELMEIYSSVSIHDRNLRSLAIEMYKTYYGISPIIMNEIFTVSHQNQYNLGNWKDSDIPELDLLTMVLRVLHMSVQRFGKLCQYIWYPNLNKKYKSKLQLLQNKCIRFCLQMDNREHIGTEHFDKINWFSIDQRCKQCLSTSVFKFFSEMCLQYMNEICKSSNQNNTVTRNSSLKLFQPLRTNKALRQKCLLYLGSFV